MHSVLGVSPPHLLLHSAPKLMAWVSLFSCSFLAAPTGKCLISEYPCLEANLRLASLTSLCN